MVSAICVIVVVILLAINLSGSITWPEISKLLDPSDTPPEVNYTDVKVDPNMSWSDILKLLDGKDADYGKLSPEKCDESCDPSKVTLTPGNAEKKTSTPFLRLINFRAYKCQLLTVTCRPASGGSTFMQFNSKEGGPTPAVKSNVNATLHCTLENGASIWKYKP
uniref:Uncharacterized protein n=1 Tax=Ditylenchus dipsaci TaxID=166011 RepID=A0A915E6I0_9BILA